MAEAASILFLGPPGVGKSHFAVALAVEAIHQGIGAYLSVPAISWKTSVELVRRQVREAHTGPHVAETPDYRRTGLPDAYPSRSQFALPVSQLPL
ncbi:ATP-binding protein [Symbiobacterium thermophilum]|uniref:ATP-binding protein n=1 Tax=Symbiobacterium thermophilum TaxID=2734 RepID=UPI0023EA667D|nr:ATP-binding protein [Symbiobacterium thermophilum]